MLDFYSIMDEHPNNAASKKLTYLGGIEEEEFEAAQEAGIAENHLNYYRDFRWSSELVKRKLDVIAKMNSSTLFKLNVVLKQTATANYGVKAFGN